MIDISNLSKARILASLYNNAKPQGMGFRHYTPEDMTESEADDLLNRFTYFDHVKGRVMKVDLSGDKLDPYLYDRDNGAGAAERVIDALR